MTVRIPRTARGSYTHNTAPAGEKRDWRHRALCRDEDPELFFPVGSTGPALVQIEEAKAVCRRCLVVSQCLSWALDTGQDAGVWGGMSEDERRALKRRGARARQPKRAPIEVIRYLADRGSSDPEIARTLAGEWTAPKVAEVRRTARPPIAAGRSSRGLRGAA